MAGEVQQLDRHVQEQSKTFTHAAKTSDSFTGSLLGATRAGAGLAVGMAGVAGVSGLLAAATGSAAAFQTNMANVSTLLLGPGTQALAALQTQVLALPPSLGTAETLAKGLYGTLSAGIEPAKAVTFVGDAARAAKAGLTDLNTSVDTIAGLIHAYGKEAEDATAISDVMFQTVNVGRGTFAQFSQAFAQTGPLAKALGANLEEVGATLGTLSFAFPSAAQAGTALNSLMTNLFQHMGEFAAMGINVKQVIAEEGLTGLLKKLKDATNDNDAALQKLIPDQEGFRAVLALTGPFAERQAGNLRDMALAAGSTSEAFKKQTATAAEAWNALIGTMDRVVQQAAPPLLSMFTGLATASAGTITVISAGFAGLGSAIVTGVDAAKNGIQGFITTMDALIPGLGAIDQAMGDATQSTERASGAYKSHGEITRERVAAEQELAAKTKTSDAAATSLAAAQANLTTITASGTATAEERANAEARVVVATDALAKATREKAQAEVESIAKTKAAAAAISELDQWANTFLLSQKKLQDQGKEATAALQLAYQGLGEKTREELQTLADGAFDNFQRILATGKEPPERLKELWATALKSITAAYQVLPEDMKVVNSQILALAPTVKGYADQLEQSFAFFGQQSLLHVQKLADGSSVTLKGMADRSIVEFTRMLDSGMATPQQLQSAWDQMVKMVLQVYGTLPPGMEALHAKMLEQGKATAQGILTSFQRLGIETKQQQALNIQTMASDLANVIKQTGEAQQQTVAMVKDASGTIRIVNKNTWDGVAQDTTTRVTATNQDILAKYKALVEAINKGEITTIPAEWAVIQAKVREITAKTGEVLLQINTDAFNKIKVAMPTVAETWEQVNARIVAAQKTGGTAFDETGQQLAGLSNEASKAGEALQKVGAKTQDTEKKVRSIADVKLAPIFTPWANDLPGVRKQMQGLSLDLLNVGNILTMPGFSVGLRDPFGYVAGQAKVLIDALEILRVKEFELENQSWDLARASGALGTTLAMAYATIGEASSKELRAAADRAVQAFMTIQQSGTESAERLREIWVDSILPQIIEAYGETSEQALTAMRKYGTAVTQHAQQTFDAIGSIAETQLQQVSAVASQFGERIGDAFHQATEEAAAFGDALQEIPALLRPSGLLGNGNGPHISPPGLLTFLRSFEHGTDFVPRNMLAVLHQGERVVPAAQNTMLRSSAPLPTASASPVTIHAPISITFPVPALNTGRIDTQAVITQLTPAIQEALDRLQIRVRQLSPR